MSERAETGAMQFEGDWRGVFIRGDNAFGYAINIKQMLSVDTELSRKIGRASLESLMELLFSSDERKEGADTQQMKRFDECKREQGEL